MVQTPLIQTSLICVVALMASVGARAQEPAARNFELSGAVDLVAPISLDASAENRMQIRSAEIMVFGPIDHRFDGRINLAAHNEDGEIAFALHEAYFGSSKMIPRSNFRVGKFLLNVGRLNAFHQHDWPFVTAPKSHREFLAPGSGVVEAESAMDTGLEYTWLIPTERFWDLTIGVTNNYCFGHCHGESEERPPYPLAYVRPTTFFGGGAKGTLLGATYMVRKDSAKVKTDLYGLDVTYKSREGKTLTWLVQSELMYQTQVGRDLSQEEKIGGYVFVQHGLNQEWLVGVRADGFSHLNMKFATTGERRADFDYALVPTVTYKHSEFATLRLAYAHEVDTTKGVGDSKNRQIQMQFVYLLGAHPSHDF